MISVIGEISNRSEPSRKFVQTFVLAEQPNGYYVLNDIFRYLVDEEELVPEEPVPADETAKETAQAPTEPAAEAAAPSLEAQVNNEAAAEKVDEKLEHIDVNGAEEQPKEPAPSNGVDIQEAEAQQPVPADEELKPEKPKTPEPTPVAPTDKEAPTAEKEAAPPAKAVPKTWANIASKSGASALVPPAIPVAPPKAAPAAASPKPAATPAPAAEPTPSQTPSNDSAGWQTAGENKKSQPRTGDDQNVLAYIKNVTEKVDASLLRQALSQYGKLKYFDVSRQKVWSFNPSTLPCVGRGS